jgi:hypothetical protein
LDEGINMKFRKNLVSALLIGGAMAVSGQASAHISYRSLDVSNPFQRSVTSNVGWADAAEANWGDSHHGAWFSFNLAQDSLVSIQVTGLAAGTYPTLRADGQALTNAGAASTPYTAVADLADVGFSIYQGLFPISPAVYENANNGAANGSVKYRDFAAEGKQGGWNALGDTQLYNDAGEAGNLIFKTAVNSSTGNTETLLNFFLAAGNYSLAAGGAIDPATGAHTGSYGIQAQLLNVAAVPVPGAVWLMITGLMGFLGLQKRRMVA